MEDGTPEVFIVMGVSASGKTTLGKALAAELGLPFFDGDDFHPPASIEKMSAGQPLSDHDRQGWLERLNEVARQNLQNGCVIGCSALKEKYRRWLAQGIEKAVTYIVLTGSFEEIKERIDNRKGHFMPPALLRSQFEALEIPEYGIHLPVTLSVDRMLARIRQAVASKGNQAAKGD